MCIHLIKFHQKRLWGSACCRAFVGRLCYDTDQFRRTGAPTWIPPAIPLMTALVNPPQSVSLSHSALGREETPLATRERKRQPSHKESQKKKSTQASPIDSVKCLNENPTLFWRIKPSTFHPIMHYYYRQNYKKPLEVKSTVEGVDPHAPCLFQWGKTGMLIFSTISK